MARIRPARHYAKPRSPVRTIATLGASQIRASIKTALKAMPGLFDHAKAVELIRHGRPRDIAHVAIDWHHMRQMLRHPFERMARTYEAGAKLGERKINGAFAARGRTVHYRKAAAGVTQSSHQGRNLKRETKVAPDAGTDLAEALRVLNGK